jgi:ketosteroid isomerase-like protein
MNTVDYDAVIEQSHRALGEFVKGNPRPMQMLFSHEHDVCIANPYGPAVCGWDQVAATTTRAAAVFRDGQCVGCERVATYVTPDLVCIVEVERYQAKLGAREDLAAFALRVTSVLRPEDGVWKIVHRHADPITTAQPADSVIQP